MIKRVQHGSAAEPLGLALSLGLHAVALALVLRATALPGGEGLPKTVSIDIVQAAAPQPAAEEQPLPQPEPEAPKPAPSPVAKPSPKPLRIAKPMADLPKVVAAEAASGRDESAATALVAAPPPSPPAAGAMAADDAISLYGQTVWSRIAAHKPRGARLPGTAIVTFAIALDGTLLSVELSGASGSAMLDQMALDTIRQAAPFPPPPGHASPAQLIFAIPFHAR